MLLFKIKQAVTKRSSIFWSTMMFKLKVAYFKGQIGPHAVIDGRVHVKCTAKNSVDIGSGFILNSRPGSNLAGITNNASFQQIGDGSISIGNDCGFTSTVLSSRKSISIGNNVKLGANVRVYDHNYHSLNTDHRRDPKLDGANASSAAVVIEDDVFIGTNALILKGVKIGARSVVGAGSVVSSMNIPPDSLVAGNPATIIQR